jgi:hypothetical protein
MRLFFRKNSFVFFGLAGVLRVVKTNEIQSPGVLLLLFLNDAPSEDEVASEFFLCTIYPQLQLVESLSDALHGLNRTWTADLHSGYLLAYAYAGTVPPSLGGFPLRQAIVDSH